jgi:hypothetical protein
LTIAFSVILASPVYVGLGGFAQKIKPKHHLIAIRRQ